MSKVRVSKAKLWKAIRNQCIEYFGGQGRLVVDCMAPKCSLFPYRMGKPDSEAEIRCDNTSNSSTRALKTAQKPTFWKK